MNPTDGIRNSELEAQSESRRIVPQRVLPAMAVTCACRAAASWTVVKCLSPHPVRPDGGASDDGSSSLVRQDGAGSGTGDANPQP